MSESQQHQEPDVQPPSQVEQEIIAGPGTRYRITHYIVVLMLLLGGAWFVWDGFFAWPRENAAAAKVGQPLPHPGYDVPLNRLLGTLLPPLGLVFLAWTLYNSRGVYRLSGSTLYIPGHPPVPLDAIRRIDKRKWDKKGIAYVGYELESGQKGQLRLDDYVYDREPADKIFDRIEKHAKELAGQ